MVESMRNTVNTVRSQRTKIRGTASQRIMTTLRKLSYHPIGQHSPLIYPHFGIELFHYASVCNNNFPSLVASFFSWRCLAASTSSFLHTSTFNAVVFQPPVLSNARMPLCMQSVHSFSFLYSVLSALHPQGFRTRLALAAARRSFA